MNWNEYYIRKAQENNGLDLSSRLRAVGKTYFGNPIEDDQLEILTQNIYDLVGDLSETDTIIDMGCGTGIIAEKLLWKYKGQKLVLVDPNLENINKCKKLFGNLPIVRFYNFDHNQTLQLVTKDTVLFTYEVIQHIESNAARDFILSLFQKNVSKIIFGGVPDLNRRDYFYENRSLKPTVKDNSDDVIGQWFEDSFFLDLSSDNYEANITRQNNLYTTHYRFDVVYERGTS